VEIIKTYEPRSVQVNGITYLVQELLVVLENGQEKRTTKSLGRGADFVKDGGQLYLRAFTKAPGPLQRPVCAPWRAILASTWMITTNRHRRTFQSAFQSAPL